MESKVRMYVMIPKGEDPYSYIATSRCTPILKVQDGSIILESKTISLSGLSLEDWLKDNPERLKYNFQDEVNDNDGSEFDYLYYHSDWKLEEIYLDINEVFDVREPYNSIHFDADKRQYLILVKRIEETFNVVEPREIHSSVYGIVFREIMLLASMEVEVHWRTILRNNGYPKSKRLTTKDYVKLQEFIDFRSELKLSIYPEFHTLSPFKDWNKDNPTLSLSWYDAYNKVKHNRSDNLCLATLENAILALAALRTMLSIRYTQLDFGEKAIIKDLFTVKKLPKPRFAHLRDMMSLTKHTVEYFKRVY